MSRPGELAVAQTTLVDAFAAAVEAGPDRTLLTFLRNGRDVSARLTGAQLWQRAMALGCGASALAPKGARVPLLMRSSEDYVAAVFGLLVAGLVPVPLFPPRGENRLDRIENILIDCAPAFALVDGGDAERVRAALPARVASLALVAVDALAHAGSAGEASALAARAPRAQDAAIIQYTSGSTSAPKGVVISHAVALANIRCIFQRYRFDRACATIDWLPPYHDMGLFGCTLTPILRGGAMVRMPPEAFLARPWRWLEAVTTHHAGLRVYSGGPNFGFDTCVDQIGEERCAALDLSAWYVAFNGAEPVRARTLERFVARFGPRGFDGRAWFPCYGMAEATLMITGPTPRAARPVRLVDKAALGAGLAKPIESAATDAGEDLGERVVPCGHVVDGHRLLIVDPASGQPLEDGRIGEIWFAGASVAEAYLHQPDATREALHARTAAGEGPFLRTGDLGFLLEGELHITGRLKDLIIIGGQNHHPNDLEAEIAEGLEGFPLHRVAAFGFGAGGDAVGVVIEWGRGQRDRLAEAERRARAAVAARRGVPIAALQFVERGAIPLTSSGKVRRADVRRLFETGALRPIEGRPSEAAPAPFTPVLEDTTP